MSLVDRIFVGGVWQNSNARYTNTSGGPVLLVAESGSGEPIADEYTIVFSEVAGGTGKATVTTSAPNNPYNGRVVTGVPLDGVTGVVNVVPGIAITFNAGTANGDTAIVVPGIYLGVFDAEGVEAGVPSDGIRHKVTNDGTGDVSNAKARLLSEAIQVKKTGTVLSYMSQIADGATPKVAGGGSTQIRPYVLKVVNVSGSGSGKTADLQVDAVTLPANSVLNLSTNTLSDGTGLKAIAPPQRYRIVSGPLSGLEFGLSSACANNDTCNVLVFPSAFIQIAPDVSGVEGSYAATDVVLTGAGQAAGVIAAGGDAYYWSRVLVPSGGDAESNPYPANVTLQASETGSAGWLV